MYVCMYLCMYEEVRICVSVCVFGVQDYHYLPAKGTAKWAVSFVVIETPSTNRIDCEVCSTYLPTYLPLYELRARVRACV
ncbi:hypothetical protein LY76DRAFT_402848 [Colletotrichum caudatum]|nr:hypothetical protein LY76DRAFT_402848 [Colletotrichum caudatum]